MSSTDVSPSCPNTDSDNEEMDEETNDKSVEKLENPEPKANENVGVKKGRQSKCCKPNKAQLLVLALIVAVLVVLVMAIVLMVMLVVVKEDVEQGDNACLTPSCTAMRIKNMLDQSVDPCEDFYQFSCGGWLDKRTLLEGEAVQSPLLDLSYKVTEEVKTILEEASSPNEEVHLTNMKILYKSCVDTDTIESRGDKYFLKWLGDNISEWPIISPQFNPANIDLTQLCVNLAKYGFPSIFVISPTPDIRNSSKMGLNMGQVRLPLPKADYLGKRDAPPLSLMENEIFQVAKVFGLEDTEKGKQDATAIVDFEILLSKSVEVRSRDLNTTYNPMTLEEFNNQYGGHKLDFKKAIVNIMSSDLVGITDITEKESINIEFPKYFQNLKQILDTTPKTTVVNYLVWRAVNTLKDALTKKVREIIRTTNNVHGITVVTNSEERKWSCVSFVDSGMGFAISKRFIQNYLDPDAKNDTILMVQELRAAFNQLLNDTDWMSKKSKRKAKEKLNAMKSQIAYPEFVMNETMIGEMYKQFIFSPANFLDNMLKLWTLETSMEYRKLREPVDKDPWPIPPQIVNAAHNSQLNAIIIFAGILQPPIFSTKYPRYLKYGGLGTVIGHEITHGFDDQGRQFDKNGNVLEWWSKSTIENFKRQKECFIKQYGSYKMNEVKMTVNSTLTQGENIADNGGLRESYMAYRDWVTRNGKEEPTLPGLNYTVDQLFFISFGQIWCSKAPPEMTKMDLQASPHSPGRYRTIGPLRNFNQFAKAFKCPRSSYMNPEEKCQVW